jgi:hypothetical protein
MSDQWLTARPSNIGANCNIPLLIKEHGMDIIKHITAEIHALNERQTSLAHELVLYKKLVETVEASGVLPENPSQFVPPLGFYDCVGEDHFPTTPQSTTLRGLTSNQKE